MTDTPDPKDGSKPPEGEPPAGDGSTGKGDDAPSSYQKLKAAHDQANADLRLTKKQLDKQGDQIAQLETRLNEKPKDDTERLANLESDAESLRVELARSKAVSRYGLSEEDAELLRGNPTEILADAEHWAKRLSTPSKAPDPAPTDGKADGKVTTDPPPPPPTPKRGEESFTDRYEKATPEERSKLDELIRSGKLKPGFVVDA